VTVTTDLDQKMSAGALFGGASVIVGRGLNLVVSSIAILPSGEG
jgi:hypothetical protein